MPKYYTVGEANRTLPLVRRIVKDVVVTHRRLLQIVEKYRSLSEDEAELELSGCRLEEEVRELTERINGFIGELEQLGILFKGFEEGLVDFYGMLDGRAIFLCWKLGEESVEWWHELDAGYAGRQRLPSHLAGVGG